MPFNQLELAPHGRAPIVLRTFQPKSSPRAIVVIAPAMGVAQSFYGLFAEWLATQGYLAITFDYRGMGLAAPRTLRGFDVNIIDWAKDCETVIEFASSLHHETKLFWIGHSLGGQLFGLISNRDRIERALTIATGNGYWHENSWPTKRVVWAFWFFFVPLLTPVLGYFPGKRMHMVGDLPRAAIFQWRRWCLNREYVAGVEPGAREAYAEVRLPITSLSFTDDEMMSERSIRSLHGLYRNALIEFQRVAPRDIGAKRIGHFGFFRAQFEPTLWTEVSRWLERS